MTRQKAAPVCGDDLARAVTYERDGPQAGQAGQHELTRRARGRLERPVRGERLRPGSGREPAAAAVPIRPTVIRTHRLAVTGELDQRSAVALEAEIDALCATGIDELLLDLEGLRRIDATGIRVITMRRALGKKRGVRIEVERVAGAVREALLAAGQLDVLPPAGARGVDENAQRKARRIV
jgi:anti-anti-sigma factor